MSIFWQNAQKNVVCPLFFYMVEHHLVMIAVIDCGRMNYTQH